MAAREARGARRGELRCPDMFARSGPAPIGAISMTTSLVKLSPSWRPGACRAVTRIMPHGRVWRVDRLAVRHKGHATGHRSRLNRDLNRSYGTKKYAFEELVAELSAAFGWQLIDHLKKADMAKEAERLLDGSGWLPEPPRLIDVAPAPAEQDGEAGPLPEFLVNEEERGVAADDDRPQLDAAE